MRIKYLVFVLVSLLVVLCSCGNNDSKETSVNDLLAKDYSNIQIETITSNEGMSTKAVYDVKKEGESYILEYSIEQYNRLSLDEEPTGEKTTKTGKIKIAGSKHEVISGEDINIDLSTLSLARFKYDSKTFDSLEVKDNTLTASLKNGKAYLNSNDDLNDLLVVINFNDSGVTKIELNYKLNNYNVKTTYVIK